MLQRDVSLVENRFCKGNVLETIPIVLVLTSESVVQKINEKKGPVKMMMCVPLNKKRVQATSTYIYIYNCSQACMAPSVLHLSYLVMGMPILQLDT